MIKSYTLWNEDAWFHLVDQEIKLGGGGATPLYGLYTYSMCSPIGYGFSAILVIKLGIDFSNFTVILVRFCTLVLNSFFFF